MFYDAIFVINQRLKHRLLINLNGRTMESLQIDFRIERRIVKRNRMIVQMGKVLKKPDFSEKPGFRNYCRVAVAKTTWKGLQ